MDIFKEVPVGLGRKKMVRSKSTQLSKEAREGTKGVYTPKPT
jgi:RNA-splicing ligase RtcB